jgi:DNA-binding SARP family transcriptional activator
VAAVQSLTLKWLGPPTVELDGHPVRLETRKVTALLAYLSLERRPQSRELLATLLWPEFDSRRAPANLRRVLTSLQESLGPGWLQADRETIALCGGEQVRTDISEVLAAVHDARAHHPGQAEPVCPSCAGKLEAAALLWRGDFLEGFNLKDCPGFDQWQMGRRDELSQCMSWVMERLVEASSEAGRWDEAIERARRWLALDELHEAGHRTLMFLYARGGKRSAALRQYKECTRLLRDELGQEPEPATQALHERIRLRKLDPQQPPAPAETTEKRAAPAPEPPAGQSPARLRPPPRRPSLVER